MRSRKRFMIVAGLLGAAVAVLPALAASEAPTISAVNYEYLNYTRHYWSPEQASVAPNGVVTIRNETSVPHGVEWKTGPATPSCSGVFVGTGAAASGTNWTGTCTFTQSGTYTFYCTVHGAEMKGTITVSAPTTGTTVTTTTGTGTQTAPGGGGTPSGPTTTTTYATPASPLAGSASQALKLKRTQRGTAVRGSLSLSQAASGARLRVDLFAGSASVAGATPARQVRVGHLVRLSLKPGNLSFKVPLSAAARHALRVHRRLRLTVKIALSPQLGPAVQIRRTVTLHA